MNVSHRFVIISSVFVTCLITANVIAVKIFSLGIGNIFLPAAVLIFPLSYIFGDVLTEVYGYKWARRIIWLGFACNLIFVIFAWVGQLLPSAPFWDGQDAYARILGYVPRILLGSFLGYLAGEFVNSFVMAKMKIMTNGRKLWTRTISSTILGEGLDTVIFITVAFAATPNFSLQLILYHWVAKVLIEVMATPLTYLVVNYLKRAENMDSFDTETGFSPFSVEVS